MKTAPKYIRNGTCSIFVFVEPLGGIRHASVHERRTAVGWAFKIKYLADEMYTEAEKSILVMDNLNTHKPASLYKTFPPGEAEQNDDRAKIFWHFQTGDARAKLISLYPIITTDPL